MANIATEHKNNVFCILYNDRKYLLSLYNAVNGTDYADDTELTVVTLEHAVLLRMHNDAAFLIDRRLNLYEQQSTVDRNMPLRDLYYVVEEYRKLVPLSRLYTGKAVKLPAPHFLTFYNGTGKQPAERVMRLSDLYEAEEEKPELELVVRQININAGYNEELLQSCESLRGYMIFVNKVREKKENAKAVARAVTEAVDECIREGVLEDFFREHRNEVIEVGIFEYNAEEHDKALRDDARDEGIELGRGLGKAEGKVEGRAEGRAESILELLEDLGDIPQSLRESVMEQWDLEILKSWLRLAAKAQSVEEFRTNAGI